eukprot:gnl/TRDRNA2_/TRDRNA2_86265_c0_seq1.p1 gnl/TRDRNA2_/TRDRNA2_86265_c0~~gnl/TRDRNA2_/TRDRNA2_86265_c0_seq1.p1  ORF type:complete len:990 (+),score=222.18 gnl/TRDRNA2_/TRDRNA2_86265_c0_seq1:396-2972(+)
MRPEDFEAAQDSDGEELPLCAHCHLPMGEWVYDADGDEGQLMHGECRAQQMLQEFRCCDEVRQKKEAELKKQHRAAYDIGWKVEQVPDNQTTASKLQSSIEGLAGLMLEGDVGEPRSVRAVPTNDPAASVNLEYLSIALKVRLQEGREAVFSLDPVVDPANPGAEPGKSMQVKRFEPEWLAGTSVGELLFQADFYLKELSMGLHDQPVVGMKSCLDFAKEEGIDMDWNAREWFVVNDASISVSEDKILLPNVEMGVEAREQKVTKQGLEDARLTRAGHPLVKYAEEFTQNFDLIAERKSVIYHLRELAKASVLAKWLIDSDICLDDSWFSLATDTSHDVGCMMIPQTWNERHFFQMRVQDGEIIKADNAGQIGLYGGVDLGLKFVQPRCFKALRFNKVHPTGSFMPIAMGFLPPPPGYLRDGSKAPEEAPKPAAPPPTAAVARPTQPAPVTPARRALVPARPRGRGAPISLPTITSEKSVERAWQVRKPIPRGMEVKGVDLNLDAFDSAEPEVVAADSKSSPAAALGNKFWSSICGDGEGEHMLRDIFNPCLSDRREEGDRFVPPINSVEYMQKMYCLVQEEAMARQRRSTHFFSESFDFGSPGELFPVSWAERAQNSCSPSTGESQLDALDLEEAEFEEVVKNAAPIFDKTTEDGMRFRVYRADSLEVRTLQEVDSEEMVGAVFSLRKAGRAEKEQIDETESVVKAVEYVEEDRVSYCRSYVMLRTAEGNAIVTSLLQDGTVTWEENPSSLHDRNAAAKVLRSADCCGSTSVRDLKRITSKNRTLGKCSHSQRKSYARGVYDLVSEGSQLARMQKASKTERSKIKMQMRTAQEEYEDVVQSWLDARDAASIGLVTSC